ncbi:hypothetical protein WA1_26615 [Scytonema hofmannii PCC 7110]|uniref:Uncharacterized protein n=1 Tax=Scytonema hofmannii PCC 7110 TaxID=128403 RepID=A0A139X6Q6_9CYAN|nr:hypothetical protein WA1_26615 [Scytonema hofmannii PCC 7110]
MYFADLLGKTTQGWVEDIVFSIRVYSNKPVRMSFDQGGAKTLEHGTASFAQGALCIPFALDYLWIGWGWGYYACAMWL